MARVVVVGSINEDLVVTADRLPGPGETVAGTGVTRSGGGKGANQAVAAARAGAEVLMVGCVGFDDAGGRMVDDLDGSGVGVDDVIEVREVTGQAIVVVAAGENTIVVVPGANDHVSPEQVEAVPLGAGDVVVAQHEIPVGTTAAAFARARDLGATTVLNPAPAAPVAPDLLALVDHLVVNEHEVEAVLGVAAAELVADRPGARSRLQAAAGATVHLTLGAEGVLVLPPSGEDLAVPGRTVEVVDSTGAGDCFVGTLAAGLAAGASLADAVERANAAAGRSVTRRGARG